MPSDPRFAFERTDVTGSSTVEGAIDAVVHLASPASPRDYLDHPIHTLKVGALGTLNALGLAKASGARFLLASTSEAYGDPLVNPQPESYWGNVNPVGPRGVYDEAKRFAEATTMAYHRVHAVPVSIARIFNTYGPTDAPRRRSRRADLRLAGAEGRADHGARRREPDALAVLRRRSRGGALAVVRLRPHRTREPRQPRGGDRAGARRTRPGRRRRGGSDRVHRASRGRPAGAPPGHLARQARARMGAEGPARHRSGADGRLGLRGVDDLEHEAPKPPPRPRIALRVVLVLLALFVAWFVLAGRLLESTDEPVRSDAVVVPSGDVLGNRLIAGARALRQTGSGRLVVFVQEGGLYDQHQVAADFLEREGVDPAQVRLVPPGGSTAEEAGAFAALAHRCGWRSAIVVTSPYHTRRAGWLFRRALGFPFVVRVLSDGEPYDRWTWWSDDATTEAVVLEWTKMLVAARYLFDRPDAPDPGVAC